MAVSTIDALYNGGSEKISATSTGVDITGTLTSSGNGGIGCVPNSIQSGFDTLQIGGNLTLNVDSTGAGAGVYMGNNVYRDSTNSRWEYINTDEASQYYQANGTHVWRYAASGSANAAISWSEAMRISSGNVGIGTSSPVNNSGYGGLTLNGANGSILSLKDSDTEVSRFVGSATETSIQYGASSVLTFRDGLSGGTERMRITSAGAKNFGAHQSGSGGFNIYAGAGSAASFAARFDGTGTGASNVVQFVNGNGQVGSISLSGTSTAYNTSSDYRLKTDAQPMTGASARVQALNPVNFEWIVNGSRVDGFLAHEAQAVVPEAVHGTKDAMKDEEYEVTPAVSEDVVIPAVLDDDGNELEAERTEQRLVTEAVMGTRSVPDYQGIDQSKLVPLLTAALQEALAKIDDMETRLAALEG